MFFSKVLSNSRLILPRKASPVKTAGTMMRQGHTLAVPARNPQTAAQNIILGILITVSCLSIPAWILYHIPDYQNEDRNVYTGK